MEQQYLSSRQVKELTGLHPVTILRWAEAGKWGHKVGGVWRFDRSQVHAFMTGEKVK